MANEFQIAEAYADFEIRGVDSAISDAAAKLRGKGSEFQRAGTAAGKGYTDGFGNGLDLGKPMTAALAKVKTFNNRFQREGRSAGEAYSRGFNSGTNLRSGMVEQVGVVKTARTAFKTEGKLAGKAYAEGFGGNSKVTTSGVSVGGGLGEQGERAGEQLGGGVERGYKRSTRGVDKETEKVAARTQAKFKALQFAGAFAGLPAAAAAGVLGVGVALGGLPMIVAAGTGALLSQNERVAESYTELGGHVMTQLRGMAASSETDALLISESLGKGFDRASGQIQTAMINSSRYMVSFTDDVVEAAENALPGLNKAISSAGPVVDGLGVLVKRTGSGLGDFFTNASRGADAAGKSLGTTGGIIQDFEGFAGSLFANLANGSTGVLPQFRAALGQVEGVVLGLSSNGMPLLQGATSGFLGTIGGGLGVLSGFVSILGSWAAPVGQATGSLFAINSIAKVFGTSLGETGFGLKAFATSVDDAGNKTTPFKTALQAADKEGSSKFKAGLNSVVSSGLNPVGIALALGAVALDVFGQAQQKAAEYVAAHKSSVQDLTAALREDNGVIGENTNRVNSKALADKNAENNLRVFGVSINTASDAIKGNNQAYGFLQTSARTALDTIARGAGVTDDQRAAFVNLANTSLETGQNYEQLKGKALDLTSTFDGEGNAINMLTEEQRNHIAAILNGTGAVGEQIRAGKEAHDNYIQMETALTGLTRSQVEARDATAKHTQAIYDQQNAMLGYRGSVLNTKSALAEYAEVSKNGKATEDEKAAALLKVEEAFAAQEAAAYKTAFANSKATDDAGRNRDALAAQNAEAVKLANSFAGPLPASLNTTIGALDLTSARAAGLTVKINETGHAVYVLPNGKEIPISAPGVQEAIDGTSALGRVIAGLPSRKDISIVTTYSTVGSTYRLGTEGRTFSAEGGYHEKPAFQNGGMVKNYDAGGPVSGKGTGTSDSIDARLSNREYVNNAKSTKKNRSWLDAMNYGGLDMNRYVAQLVHGLTAPAPTASGAARSTGAGITVNVYQQPGQDPAAFAAEVSREIALRMDSGGDW